MPDVMDAFAHLNDLSQGEMHARYQALKATAAPAQLSDEVLQELIAINRILRRRAAAPTAKKAASARSAAPSLDAL